MTIDNIQRIYLDGRHYDLAYSDYTEDIDFWVEQAKRYGGPVLEIACGTGRITMPLAKEGYEVTGIDLAESMLEQAERNSQEQGLDIEWVKADMRDFRLGKRFPLIICPGQSISRLLTIEDIERCLAAVREHLAPGGRFIMELYNPSLEILSREEGERSPFLEYEHPDGSGTVRVEFSSRYDQSTQVLHLRLYYSIPGVSGEPTEHVSNRMYFPQELDALLKYNGFGVVEKYGDFDGKAFESGDTYQVVVCGVAG